MLSKEKVTKVVGAANVSTDAAVLEGYARDLSFVNSIKPKCVIKVSSTEDVQQVVKLSNESGTPLVPISSGPPHFVGIRCPV